MTDSIISHGNNHATNFQYQTSEYASPASVTFDLLLEHRSTGSVNFQTGSVDVIIFQQTLPLSFSPSRRAVCTSWMRPGRLPSIRSTSTDPFCTGNRCEIISFQTARLSLGPPRIIFWGRIIVASHSTIFLLLAFFLLLCTASCERCSRICSEIKGNVFSLS